MARIQLDSFYFTKDGYKVRPSAFVRKTDRQGVHTHCVILDAESGDIVATLWDDPSSIVARTEFTTEAGKARFLESARKSPCAIGFENEPEYLLSEYARQITMQADEAWVAFLTKPQPQ